MNTSAKYGHLSQKDLPLILPINPWDYTTRYQRGLETSLSLREKETLHWLLDTMENRACCAGKPFTKNSAIQKIGSRKEREDFRKGLKENIKKKI